MNPKPIISVKSKAKIKYLLHDPGVNVKCITLIMSMQPY